MAQRLASVEVEGSQRGAGHVAVYRPLKPGEYATDSALDAHRNIFDVRTSEGRKAAAQKVRTLRRVDPEQPILMDYTFGV